MRLVSVDPGSSYFAATVFDEGILTSTHIWRADSHNYAAPWRSGRLFIESLAKPGATVLCENMVVYPKQKTPPNDLILVQTMVGAILCAEGYQRALKVDPASWKGQRPKSVCKRLAKAAFQEKTTTGKPGKVISPKEYAAVNWDNEHIVDSVGIGLHHLKRAFV